MPFYNKNGVSRQDIKILEELSQRDEYNINFEGDKDGDDNEYLQMAYNCKRRKYRRPYGSGSRIRSKQSPIEKLARRVQKRLPYNVGSSDDTSDGNVSIVSIVSSSNSNNDSGSGNNNGYFAAVKCSVTF